MSRFTRLRPSPAMIVACAALFVALGGVGYAAATIGSSQIKNNSVRGKDIRNSTITGKDVKNSGLTGSDIKNSSLAGRDVKNNSLTGSDILESSLGTVPSANNAGTAGRAGSAGAVDSQKNWAFGLNDNQAKVVASYGGLDLIAFCDPQSNNTDPIGGTDGTAYFIKNNRGPNNGVAQASDTNSPDYDFDLNDGVSFNLNDWGDGGAAFLPDGHFLAAADGATLATDTTQYTAGNIPTDCYFSGTATGS